MDRLDLERSDARTASAAEREEACGCTAGAVAASVALLAYVAAILVVVGTPPHWGAAELLWGLAVVVAAALAGKAVGVVRSRRRWFDELERLAQGVRADGGGGA